MSMQKYMPTVSTVTRREFIDTITEYMDKPDFHVVYVGDSNPAVFYNSPYNMALMIQSDGTPILHIADFSELGMYMFNGLLKTPSIRGSRVKLIVPDKPIELSEVISILPNNKKIQLQPGVYTSHLNECAKTCLGNELPSKYHYYRETTIGDFKKLIECYRNDKCYNT